MRSIVALACLSIACSQAPVSKHPLPSVDKPVMTGVLARALVESIPGWTSSADIDVDAAKKLASVAPASVTIIIGTWCGDSKRELPRLWKALDVAGPVPWQHETIGVDRDKRSPGLEMEIAYVPLVIVRRDGAEVGRIVESAPNGIERDLLALLDGTKTGVISGRAELAAGKHPQ